MAICQRIFIFSFLVFFVVLSFCVSSNIAKPLQTEDTKDTVEGIMEHSGVQQKEETSKVEYLDAHTSHQKNSLKADAHTDYEKRSAESSKYVSSPPPHSMMNNVSLHAHPIIAAVIGLSQLTLATKLFNGYSQPADTCNVIKETLNQAVSKVKLCPWNYSCDYQENRYPRYLVQAKCVKQYEIIKQDSCSEDSTPEVKMCEEIKVPATTLVSRLQDDQVSSGSGDYETEKQESRWLYDNIELHVGCVISK